ncbi:MAG: phosphohydrolase [Rhizobacter sp.]|nr:phosphohydrolase [Rhizobacter sp.]
MSSLADIARLFDRKGACQYSGEPVSQLEHALQTAQLAEQSGAGDALVTASLLHDLGHLLDDRDGSVDDTPTLRGVDDMHQYAALPLLRGLFDESVLAPIRLHVEAKRYLCHARPDYFASLTDDSKRSLVLQGGVFEADEAARFLTLPGAHDAVRLRQWDDLAKRAGLDTAPLTHFLACASRCALPAQCA